MSYRCPICRDFFTETASAMCTHMMNATKKFDEHTEWIESHSISYPSLVRTGNYAPLRAVVEKECKIED